jgi:phosphatidylserine/phosphatidylglycerophosphate/cardiolipin synthase-like enzyme
MSRQLAALLTLVVVVLIAFSALREPSLAAGPTPTANDAITPLLLGSLTGSASTAPGPADTLFATLAAGASSSIDIALYDFDRATVRDALLAAHGRGVTVRVVADGEDAAEPGFAPFYTSLLSSGISVITDTKSSLMHNKFAVFDDQVTWTGSANFTNTGFTFNAENAIVITDTVVAGIYATEFAEMFAGDFSNDKTDNTAHSATVGGMQLEIAFSPTDSVQNRIVDTLNTANTSVQVAMFTFTNDAIGDALLAAHNRGVAVEVLLDQVAAGGLGSERDRLCAGGVTVRVENFSGKIHDKYAVVDDGTSSDPLIVTGSTNWTANAVQANDENLLIAHDAGLASAYAADFARIRAAITPGGFTCNVGSAITPTVAQYIPIIQRGQALTPTSMPTATVVCASASITPACLPTFTPTATATATQGPTATPTLPPPTYNNCQADPNPSAAPNYPVRIVNIDKQAETVTLRNVTTGDTIDLTGWQMCSITGNQHHPISGTLAPGETRTFPNTGGPIWNNSNPDPGALYNENGQLVSYFPD